MNLYEMLKDKLPEERKENCTKDDLGAGWMDGHNFCLSEVIELLKKHSLEFDEDKLAQTISGYDDNEWMELPYRHKQENYRIAKAICNTNILKVKENKL